MYLLKKNFSGFLLPVLIFFSCSSKGPLTPEEAFYKLKYYVNGSQMDGFVSLLSESSIDKIQKTRLFFTLMSEEQLSYLSRKYIMGADKLKNLSVEDYVKIYFLEGNKNDLISRAIKSDIVSVNTHEKRSKITMENGHFLFFVKEGPYWKFEMSEL